MSTNIPPAEAWAALGLEKQLEIRQMSVPEAAQLLGMREDWLRAIRDGAVPTLVEAAKLYGRLCVLPGWVEGYPGQLQTFIEATKQEPAAWARGAGYPKIASSMRSWLDGTKPTRMSLHSIYLSVFYYLAAETDMLLPEYDHGQWNPAFFDQFRKLYDISVVEISEDIEEQSNVRISPSTIEAWLYGFWEPTDRKKKELLRQWFSNRIDAEYGPPKVRMEEEGDPRIEPETDEEPAKHAEPILGPSEEIEQQSTGDAVARVTELHLQEQNRILAELLKSHGKVLEKMEMIGKLTTDLVLERQIRNAVEITKATLLSFIPENRKQVALAELGRQFGKSIDRQEEPFKLGE